jgi:hypothetical protein
LTLERLRNYELFSQDQNEKVVLVLFMYKRNLSRASSQRSTSLLAWSQWQVSACCWREANFCERGRRVIHRASCTIAISNALLWNIAAQPKEGAPEPQHILGLAQIFRRRAANAKGANHHAAQWRQQQHNGAPSDILRHRSESKPTHCASQYQLQYQLPLTNARSRGPVRSCDRKTASRPGGRHLCHCLHLPRPPFHYASILRSMLVSVLSLCTTSYV